MKTSEHRILTTHAGSLPRPQHLRDLLKAQADGAAIDAAALGQAVDAATGAVVAKQLDVGLDVINDGEQGRESFFTYVQHRMSGFGGKSERVVMRDLSHFAEYGERMQRQRDDDRRINLLAAPRAQSAVRYTEAGRAAIAAEVDRFSTVLANLDGAKPTEAFLTSPSPGIIAAAMQNDHYDSLTDYIDALAGALESEYCAITDAGFLLQVDAPDLALERHTLFQDQPLSVFLDFCRAVIDAMNRALAAIPREQIRLHVCWGNYGGPHIFDVPLADIWPEIVRTRAGALLLSMANPRHAHEYHHFRDAPLPDGMVILAGVIDTTTNYVEHPETVADRILHIAEAVGDPTRILAGTDCGFETSAGMAAVASDVVWTKLEALAEGAALASQRLFR